MCHDINVSIINDNFNIYICKDDNILYKKSSWTKRDLASKIEPDRLDLFEISKVHATNATEMGGILEHIESKVSKHVGNKALNK